MTILLVLVSLAFVCVAALLCFYIMLMVEPVVPPIKTEKQEVNIKIRPRRKKAKIKISSESTPTNGKKPKRKVKVKP